MDTKKLRQKILDLAIHGKLVPQDPNDEPASVLLERIRAEKERLVKEGKIKKSKTSKTSDTPHYENRQVGKANVPFEVPGSWEWTTVNAIAKSILYGVSESAKTCGKYKLLRITDIQNNNVQWDTVPYTDFDTNKAESYLLNDGDILFARTGATVGKSYLVEGLEEEAIYASYLIRVQTYDAVLPQYVKFYFESGYYWEQIVKESVGVGQPNVNGTILGNLNIPIPPIHEQGRIVSELSKWMDIIDRIEQGKIDLRTIIKEAKSKILDLAIHGKLVPQDPNDEPASELLKRINPKAEITCDNGQYGKIPENWCVTKLGDISNYGENENIQVEDIDSNEWVLELEDIEKDSANIIQVLKKHERCINGIRHKFTKGNILYSKLRTYLNKVLIAPKDGYCTTEVMAFNALGGMSNEYICHVLRSSYFLDYTLQCGYGVKMPRLSTTDACNGLIPLPPFAEQQRIVDAIDKAFAKLDAIMESL